ncbi:TPA: hypothetical protein DCQ44_02500, partial [Candidatus Taylorbacteria bacterium]|nr:hypothetical protein [Candidatus Taylorbacteria bacterium]
MWHTIKKTVLYLILTLFIIVVLGYSTLWLFSFKHYDVSFGVSFSPAFATSLGLDWKETYQAILNDLKPKYLRIPAPWTEVEADQGKYTFQNVDYMLNEAAKHNVKVVLVIGQKQPRWPECYFPDWAKKLSLNDRKKALLNYETAVISRYAKNPTLESWQVENEPFINFNFGECSGYDESAVKDEVALVQQLDPARKIIITDSGELSTWFTASRTGDILGVTLYRIVRTPNNSVWHYTYMPTGAYRLKADIFGENFNSFYISELQAEPWFGDGTAQNTPVNIQEQTMNPEILKSNIASVSYT